MNAFMSPIAIASAKAAYKRVENGESIKGSGRRRTVYKRPPITDLIAKCGSIQALGRMRGALAVGAERGNVNPSEKTERKWERAFWKRVIEIMLTTREPVFVYNHQLRWAKPSKAMADAIEAAFEAQCKMLPSPVEELRAAGIAIEGVT